MAYTYETTYEETDPATDAVLSSLEVRYIYNVTPGRPEVLYPNDKAHPEEPAEIELINIHVEAPVLAGGTSWFDATPLEYDRLEAYADDEDILLAMLEHASDEIEGRAEDV